MVGARKLVRTLLIDLIRVDKGAARRHDIASVPFEGQDAALVTLSKGYVSDLIRIGHRDQLTKDAFNLRSQWEWV